MQVYRNFFLALLLFSGFLSSAYAVDLLPYQGEAPVASYSPEDWQKAIAPALQQVLVKVSGNPNIAQVAAIRKAMSKASSMVQTFAYAHSMDGGGKEALMLRVRFSSKMVDALLQDANQSVVAGETVPSSPVPQADVGNTTAAVAAGSPVQDATLRTINMVVSGVSSLKDYATLLSYVRALRGVVDVSSKQAKGDRVLLVVTANSTMDDLAQVVANDNKLIRQSVENANAAALVLSYRWVADGAVSTVSGGEDVSTQAAQPFAQSGSIAPPAPQQLVPGVADSAPVVEGVPFTGSSDVASNKVSDAAGEVQSFAAPPADNSFAVQ